MLRINGFNSAKLFNKNIQQKKQNKPEFRANPVAQVEELVELVPKPKITQYLQNMAHNGLKHLEYRAKELTGLLTHSAKKGEQTGTVAQFMLSEGLDVPFEKVSRMQPTEVAKELAKAMPHREKDLLGIFPVPKKPYQLSLVSNALSDVSMGRINTSKVETMLLDGVLTHESPRVRRPLLDVLIEKILPETKGVAELPKPEKLEILKSVLKSKNDKITIINIAGEIIGKSDILAKRLDRAV